MLIEKRGLMDVSKMMSSTMVLGRFSNRRKERMRFFSSVDQRRRQLTISLRSFETGYMPQIQIQHRSAPLWGRNLGVSIILGTFADQTNILSITSGDLNQCTSKCPNQARQRYLPQRNDREREYFGQTPTFIITTRGRRGDTSTRILAK